MVKKLFKKKLLAVVIAITMLFVIVAFTGCGGIRTVFAWYEGDGEYGTFQLVLNAEETYTVRHERFQFLDFDFEAVELEVVYETHENVVSVNGNTITALNNGRAEIVANLREGEVVVNGRRYDRTWQFRMGEVRVLDEANMTEIWTAQDLADMNNDLDGSFVLRSSIDLADFGDWTPIGGRTLGSGFSGAFINPNKYRIDNLHINTVLESDDERLSLGKGLFTGIEYAFISGIILENVNIVALAHEGANAPRTFVGGIAASVFRSTIVDVSVSGNIVGNHRVGGIAGSVADSEIINSSFNGYVEVIWETYDASAGGIAGEMFGLYRPHWRWQRGLIDACTVEANITGQGRAIVGGIVGVSNSWHNHENTFDIVNSTFDGDLTGHITGTLRGRGAP